MSKRQLLFWVLLGSLSSDVFERRTSTGSGRFALLSHDFEQIFGQIVSIRIKTLGNKNTVASRLIKREKGLLPVDVRRSKTSLLKLPITGNVQLEDSFDLSILNENPMVPQSSLGFYLEWLTKEGNLATVVIMNGMTISLVGQNNNIIIIDGQLGAMVGLINIDKVEELLIFVEQQ